MARKKGPSKEDIKRAVARATRGRKAKTTSRACKAKTSAIIEDDDEMEELPGGVVMPRPKSRRGRPAYKYNPQYAVVAEAMLRKGGTTAELAEVFDISIRTVYKWRCTYPDFDAAFSSIGHEFDSRIERTLAERCLGYTYDAVKIFNFQGKPLIVPYQEHVPPDIGAIKLWLSSKQPEKWKTKDDEANSSAAEAFVELWKRLGNKQNVTLDE